MDHDDHDHHGDRRHDHDPHGPRSPGRPARAWAADPPPDDLDLLTAPDDVLRRHGLPSRPDARHDPTLARVWSRALAHRPTFVRAALEQDPHHGLHRPPRPAAQPSAGPDGWGGFELSSYDAHVDRFTWAFGTLWVPPVVPDTHGADRLTIGFWVGLDGGYGGLGDQVLQAGVRAVVEDGHVTYTAWTEWYTDEYDTPAAVVSGFPVRQGDLVSVLVCAWSDDVGTITLQNLTAGVATVLHVPAPGDDVRSAGLTAEWVVEGVSRYLPDFNATLFLDCHAGDGSQVVDGLAGAGAPAIEGSDTGAFLTGATAITPTFGAVQWYDWD